MRRPFAASAVLVLALSIIPAAPASAAGVGDWHYNAATRHTYGLTGEMPWADAEALAVRLGGHLVTINDQAEQDWLLAQFPDPYLWIGINDRAREGTWVWASKARVTFTAWQAAACPGRVGAVWCTDRTVRPQRGPSATS